MVNQLVSYQKVNLYETFIFCQFNISHVIKQFQTGTQTTQTSLTNEQLLYFKTSLWFSSSDEFFLFCFGYLNMRNNSQYQQADCRVVGGAKYKAAESYYQKD